MSIKHLINHLPRARWIWFLILFLSFGLIVLAHGVFQVWLYMKPCEQCVYIRFAFLLMGVGGVIAFINPKIVFLRLIGYVLGFWGAIYGVMCSWKLRTIHHAIHSDDPMAVFGMQGCSMQPHYPFGIPIEKWAPDWFLPTGDCGYDNADVPANVILSELQKNIIHMYDAAGGWYLIPSKHFMSMADCCLLAFVVAILIYLVMLFIDVKSFTLQRRES